MRKLLLSLIIVLLLVLGYVTLTNGIQIGNFNIWSIAQLKDSNQDIDTKIEKINTLIDVQYPKKISDIKTASKNMENAKEEYLNYTNLSSDEDILRAMQKESYSIEFLWTKIGNHATSEGVNLKFEIVSSSQGANNVNDLSFTVQGTYIGITNFIYAIENDEDLNFRIQNFKLLPNNGNILQGTFRVNSIAIQGNTSNMSTSGTSNKNNESTKNEQANAQSNTTNTQTDTTNTQTNTQNNEQNTNSVAP